MRNFDRVAGIYDSTRGLPPFVMTVVVSSLADELRNSGTILDAGVGTGRFAGPLKEKGLDVVGLDVSKAMLSEAKKKSLTNLVMGELTTMPFANEAFDSCLMVHVLHLVENPMRLLSEIARVCRSSVLSVAEVSDKESIREDYIRLRSEMGHQASEISEHRLMALVTPTKLKDIVTYPVETRADDDITHLRDRISSVTWDVPDDVHEGIINRLATTMGGKVYKSNKTIKLAIWDVDSIRSVDFSHA